MRKETIDAINAFRDQRRWRQFHNPKDLAISIALESSQLLEIFQWKTNEEALSAGAELLREDLADVLIYCSMLACDLDLDMDAIILEKLKKNELKYPVDESLNSKLKYN